MKLLFVISSLRAGGAERVASLLLNNWADKIKQLVIVTFDQEKNDFYRLDSRVKRLSINIFNIRSNFFRRIWLNILRIKRLREQIINEKPDIVISFIDQTNVITLLASIFIKIPIVISERIYPPYIKNTALFNWVRNFVYKFCTAFVGQTDIIASWAQKILNQEKIKVIPNPINNYDNNLRSTLENKTILAVGRLDKQKGFDMLIEAFKLCHHKDPDWQLIIVGEGSERKNLEAQIQKLKLVDSVKLVGIKSDIQEYYKTSTLFVLSSRAEGFPNALLEAMGYGLAVVSFNCKSGPSDIIINGENGILVPENDINSLSEAINQLIEDRNLREKLATNALKVRERYHIELISEQWLKLLQNVAIKENS